MRDYKDFLTILLSIKFRVVRLINNWEKDINTFVQLYPKIQNGIFVSTLRWIGADPKNPASIFKIVFKNENKITTVKIFKLDTPNK